MPKKYDKFGYGIVERQYEIACPHCGEKTGCNDDDYNCDKCGKPICPDCLKPLVASCNNGSSSNGSWHWAGCSLCGHTLEDY